MLKEGSQAPLFTARNQEGREIRLADLLGKKNVVLYFYPKDGTPGWTLEARGFRDLYAQFEENDVTVLGVSLESAGTHRRFRDRQRLPFDLLVDPDLALARLYDVNVTNLLVVKLARRVTYLIGKDGIILKAYKRVRPREHAAEILKFWLGDRDSNPD
jgi:thioredoxin-dependent peroxiredoxin